MKTPVAASRVALAVVGEYEKVKGPPSGSGSVAVRVKEIVFPGATVLSPIGANFGASGPCTVIRTNWFGES